MAEPKRLESVPTAEAAERDSRAEALLVDGLDRYFAGQYEDAIHLWTRVLFLDRTHARARAYIDRARTALAERQRRAEEMLQASQALLDRGETGQARDLLTAVVATAGEDERAADLRARLERLERVHAGPRPGGVSVRPLPGAWYRPTPASPAVWMVAAAAVLLIIGLRSPGVRERLGWLAPPQDLVATHTDVTSPAPPTSEVALIRARTLFERGRLAEALRALDRVGLESPQRATADQMRIDIERLLLASERVMTAASRGKEVGRP